MEGENEEILEEATDDAVVEKPVVEPPKEEPAKKQNRFNARIGELKQDARLTREENSKLKAENAELRKAKEIKAEPKEEDHADYESFRKEKEKWLVQERARVREEVQEEFKTEQEEKKQRKSAEEANNRWAKQQEKGNKEFENWNDSALDVNEVLDNYGLYDVKQEIFDSDEGAALVDYYAKNMSELDKLADLPPRARRRQLFEIEKEVGTKQPKKVSDAPKPTSKVQGGASRNKTLDQMTQAEYNEYMNKKMR